MFLVTLREARERAKVAEKTSDLSSYENITRKKKSSKDIVVLPQFSEPFSSSFANEENGKVPAYYAYYLFISNCN